MKQNSITEIPKKRTENWSVWGKELLTENRCTVANSSYDWSPVALTTFTNQSITRWQRGSNDPNNPSAESLVLSLPENFLSGAFMTEKQSICGVQVRAYNHLLQQTYFLIPLDLDTPD